VHAMRRISVYIIRGVARGGMGASSIVIGKFFPSHFVDFSIGMFCIFYCVSVESTSIFVSRFGGFALRPHPGSAPGPRWGIPPLDPLLVPLSNSWLRSLYNGQHLNQTNFVSLVRQGP